MFHWTRDFVTSPAVDQCSTSGAVTSNGHIHIRYQPPTGYTFHGVQEIRVHEQAGHTPDTVYTGVSFDGSRCDVCGDPTGPEAASLLYCDRDAFYEPGQAHNGPYDITVTVQSGRNDWNPQTHTYTTTTTTSTTTITVDIENLLVTGTTPANPEIIKWDPDTMTQVPLSCAYTACYHSPATATLRIYQSDQTLVRTLEQTVMTDGGSVNFVWDGKDEGTGGSPVTQPKGVYLFSVTLHSSAFIWGADSDKSGLLALSQTHSELTGDYDETTDKNTTRDACVLTDSGTPKADASACQVRVFGKDLTEIVASTALPLTTNAPAASPPVWDEATFPLVIEEEETHLFSARDDHPAQDKGHRQRWALQHNMKPKRPRADCYAVELSGPDVTAKQALRRLGYAAYAQGEKTTPTIYELLQYDRVMFYTGIGAYDVTGDPNMYGVVGAYDGIRRSILMGYSNASFPSMFPGRTWKFLRTLPAGALSGVKLAVWLACLSATSGTATTPNDYRTGNVVDESIGKGAECSVGMTAVVYVDGYPIWTTTFFNELKAGHSVQDATTAAMSAARAEGHLGYEETNARVAGNKNATVTLPK